MKLILKPFAPLIIWLLSVTPVWADSIQDATTKLKKAGGAAFGSELDPAQAQAQLAEKVGKLIGIVLTVIGAFFLILLIYGGYKWMMARGAPEEAKKAKDIITDAVIGLIIILAAYLISTFVVGKLTEAVGIR